MLHCCLVNLVVGPAVDVEAVVFARLQSRVHETSSVSMASSCVERNASASRRSLRALRYATRSY